MRPAAISVINPARPLSFRTSMKISTKRAVRNAKTGLNSSPATIIHQAQVGRLSMVWNAPVGLTGIMYHRG